MITGYDLYRDIMEKCVDKYIECAKGYIEEKKDWIGDTYDKDDYEEFKDKANKTLMCIRSIIDGYVKIACGIASDDFIHKYYNMLMEKVKVAKESRLSQAEMVKDKIEELREDMKNTEDPQEYGLLLDLVERCEIIVEDLEYEAKEFSDLYNRMCKCTTKEEMVVMIDRIINMAHSRGSVLPLMCGCVLEEYIHHPYEEEYYVDMYGDFCVDLCDLCTKMLDCICDYHSGVSIKDIIMGAIGLVVPAIMLKVLKREEK